MRAWALVGLPALAALAGAWSGRAAEATATRVASRANTLPRKVIVASALANFTGPLEQRVALAEKLIDGAARQAAERYAGRTVDLIVLPEFALGRAEANAPAEARALRADDPELQPLRAKAREHHTYLVVPMTLREGTGASSRLSNAAVLLDRRGEVAGIFRKVHPVVDDTGVFEGGVAPGDGYPVFDCDFGRVGILICWDMAYEEAWDALANNGAEIVALPSASPQTVRPSAQALRHRYYVVTSTPRDNATLFDPIGRTFAQISSPGVWVQEIDLSFAILHWAEALENGQALTARFGERVGYRYSEREDTGVFWSNDAHTSIGAMVRKLGLREMPEAIERVEAARKAFAAKPR